MHRRRVTVANIYPCSKQLEDVTGRSAILGVSMANPTYSGPSLLPLLRWASLHFHPIPVLLGDYLERHNILGIETQDPDLAGFLAMEKANSLRASIVEGIKQFPASGFALYSAHEMMATSEFASTHSELVRHFKSVRAFGEIIMTDVRAFLDRKVKRGEVSEATDQLMSESVSYILEELALFSMMASRGHLVQIYPGRHLNVFVALANNDLKSPVFGLNELTCIDLSIGH